MTPPHGHWHRRSAKPDKLDRDVLRYRCTETGCTWSVYVLPDHRAYRTLTDYDKTLPEFIEGRLDSRPTSIPHTL